MPEKRDGGFPVVPQGTSQRQGWLAELGTPRAAGRAIGAAPAVRQPAALPPPQHRQPPALRPPRRRPACLRACPPARGGWQGAAGGLAAGTDNAEVTSAAAAARPQQSCGAREELGNGRARC